MSLLVLLEAGFSVAAQEVPAPETEAARLYHQAQEQWREIWQANSHRDIIWDLLGNPERLDRAEAERFIQTLQPMLATLRRAIDAGDPMYSVRHEDGWDAHLPHLAVMRGLIQPLAMDIHWRMYEGRNTGIGADIARMFAAGQTLRGDRMIVSSMVEISTFVSGANIVNDALGQGALSQQDAATLLRTIDASIASEDMFGIAAAFDAEAQHTTDWMLRVLAEEGGPARILDSLVPSQGREGGTMSVATLNSAELEAGAHLYREAMERSAEILRIDDLAIVRSEYQRLMDDVENGMYGPIAAAIGPFRANIAETLIQSAAIIDETQARLRLAASSPEGARALLNAAIWYRRAIAEWNRLDPEMRKTILGTEAEHLPSLAGRDFGELSRIGTGGEGVPDEPVAPDLNQALAAGQPILAILLEASRIERCAFDDSAHRRLSLWPMEDYVPGMRELGGLLEVASRAALARGDAESSGPLLRAAIVMCDHLAQDALAQSSDAAADTFASTAPLLLQWIARPDDPGAAGEARAWLLRLDAGDPFGHRAAIRAAAARATYAFSGRRERKDTLERDLRYISFRNPRFSEAEGVSLALAVHELRESEWPRSREMIVEIVAASAAELAAATTAETLAAAEAGLAERLASPDAVLIKPIAVVFVVPMLEMARSALAAEVALAELLR